MFFLLYHTISSKMCFSICYTTTIATTTDFRFSIATMIVNKVNCNCIDRSTYKT